MREALLSKKLGAINTLCITAIDDAWPPPSPLSNLYVLTIMPWRNTKVNPYL